MKKRYLVIVDEVVYNHCAKLDEAKKRAEQYMDQTSKDSIIIAKVVALRPHVWLEWEEMDE